MSQVNIFTPRGIQLSGTLNSPDDKNGHIIIFAHDFLSERSGAHIYDAMAARFRKSGYTTLQFDFSGVGESEDDVITLEHEKEDLRSVSSWAKTNGYDKQFIVATSFASVVAMTANLDKVKSMILIDPMLCSTNYDWGSIFPAEQLDILSKEGVMKVYDDSPTSRKYFTISKQTLADLSLIDTDKIFENVKCPISVLISNYEEYGDFLSEITEKYFSKLPKGSKIDVIRDDSNTVKGLAECLSEYCIAWCDLRFKALICVVLNMFYGILGVLSLFEVLVLGRMMNTVRRIFNPYRDILSLPGTWKFSLAGFIMRFPMSMISICVILLVSSYYHSYAVAGKVSAVSVISYALAVPFLSRMVDEYGQRKIMLPAIIVSASTLIMLVFSIVLVLPPWVLYCFAGISAAFSGSAGTLVRSRWAKAVKNSGQLHTAYALEAALDEVVYIVGPIIATLLTINVYPPLGLLVAAFLNILGAFWLFSFKSTEPDLLDKDKSVKESSLIRIKALCALCVIYCGLGAMLGLCNIVVIGYTEEVGVKSASGIVLAIFASGSLIAAILYGSRTWNQPLWKLFIVSILLGIGISTFVFATNLYLVSLVMFISGMTISPTMINVSNMVQRIVPKNRLTEGLSWMSSSINIGIAFGSFLGGYLFDYGGSALGFPVVIAFAWFMVLIALACVRVLRK